MATVNVTTLVTHLSLFFTSITKAPFLFQSHP